MNTMRLHTLLFCAALSLSACSPAAAPAQDAPAAEAIAIAADGEAATLAPIEAGDAMQWAASVTQVDYLRNQQDGGAKLFGLAGGDPAMNGLHTHIAFFQGPAEGWRVFRIGDFLNYRVLADTPGRIDLEIQESTMNANGEIGSRTRYAIVTWMPGVDGAAPESIAVTPARAAQ